METRRILWPTDFSGNSEKALPHIQSLTKLYAAQIHVLYVIQEIAHPMAWYGDSGEMHIHELTKQAKYSAKKRLDQICENFMPRGFFHEKHIAIGDPAQEILTFIKAQKIDQVVMATRGEKGHFQFGSVCEKVMKNSPVPVTAIPIFPDIAA